MGDKVVMVLIQCQLASTGVHEISPCNRNDLDRDPIARSTCITWSESGFESTSGWGSHVNGAYVGVLIDLTGRVMQIKLVAGL